MIHLEAANEAQKPILANLMQMYQHDLSGYDGTLPDSSGIYSTGQFFDLYWVEPERHPFLIYDDGIPIGFALVRSLDSSTQSVAEFFIIRPARGKGKGSVAAKQLFDMFPGRWHVAQQKENLPAQTFWKSVITSYTAGGFEESWSNASPIGPQQNFNTTT